MKERRALIKKLRNIVSLGHTPQREFERYFFVTQTNQNVCSCVNCFAHACFNLSNEEIERLEITEKQGQVFGTFQSEFTTPDEGIERQIINFIRKTGLEIEPILKQSEALEKNQWKVAMYIDHSGLSLFGKDFHFFLQEKDGTWSHKRGYCSDVERKEVISPKYSKYDYYKTYVITNPFAREK